MLRQTCYLDFKLMLFILCIAVANDQPDSGSPQPIVAVAGDDVIIPFHVDPVSDEMTVEWTRVDPDLKYVHVRRDGRDDYIMKHPSYRDRTGLFLNDLKNGNVSLRISKVRRSDEGTYRCFIPSLNRDFFAHLIVVALSEPKVWISGLHNGSVVLLCETEGWYPQPEMSWLDSDGNLLPAGDTETDRNTDGFYTVRRNVTVEQTDTDNRFTCRVQLQRLNQRRETEIPLPAKLNCSHDGRVTVGLHVASLVISVVISMAASTFTACYIMKIWKDESEPVLTANGQHNSLNTSLLLDCTPKREAGEMEVLDGTPGGKYSQHGNGLDDSGYQSPLRDPASITASTRIPLSPL